MNSEGSSFVKVLRCPTCGAPLKPSAESILTICNFCGEVTAESPIRPHAIVKPMPLTPPPSVGQVRKMELVLVPFFEVIANVDVDASGYQRRQRTESRTVRRGGKSYVETRTITEYRPWRMTHHGRRAIRFLARQEVTLFGADEFITSVTRGLGGKAIAFNPDYIKDLASKEGKELIALSPEWNQKESARKAGEVVYEAAYSAAKSQMHEVFDTKVSFKPTKKPALVHVPLLLVRQAFQGRSYRAAYHWGSGELLREELPIKNRGLMAFFAFLFFLATPVFAQLANDYGYLEEAWFMLGLFAVLGLGSLIVAILLMVRIYQPHKIKSSGGKLSFKDFQVLPPSAYAPLTEPDAVEGEVKAKRFCPKCGDPLDPKQTFCEKCGYKI